MLAWTMYSDENDGLLVPNPDLTISGVKGWVSGKMQWDTGFPWPDNYNLNNLSDSSLGQYCAHSTRIYKCPGDRVPGLKGPRVRSISMNGQMGGIAGSGADEQKVVNNYGSPVYKLFLRASQIHAPDPSDAWVFVDEQADSINDGFFRIAMNDPANWWDLPAAYHGQSGSICFADGHSEIRVWADSAIRNRSVLKKKYTAPTPITPGASDLLWFQSHTTAVTQ
jgi:prepilin-type processing-associated H-X9-DG protein